MNNDIKIHITKLCFACIVWLVTVSVCGSFKSRNALLSVDGGGETRGWHGWVVPVCLCTGICSGQHKAASVWPQTYRHTYTPLRMCLESANFMVFIPLSCFPSSSHSALFSSQLHLSASLSFCCLFLLFLLNYSCEPIVPNGLCTADTNVFISFRACVQRCVFERSK